MIFHERPWTIALIAAGAVAPAGGGYAAGARTPSSAGPSCAEASQLVNGFVEEWIKLDKDDARRLLKARSAADVIVQNPDCFSFSSKVQAQSAADRLGRSGNSLAIRLAAGMAVCEATGRQPFTCQR
ncbi:hypothetical protein OG689_09835 [Kitasatospora sp. NBC_00240]|uniref:hypothetical protein n=1 Tax=Kitasatospora sp. NBC_00240 TaxID=2903567 RepID=UPI002254926F|nr:hypothetical protein [Kitasatospora sp. NBC_00240]MCX5209582.1 hypothetical protein [Kitasatospora sp. NBC_00240]